MTGRKILIVDDESAIRDMLRVALEMAEYQVLEASSAQDAHSLIIDEKPDLILLDWMMPGTSGIELARRSLTDGRAKAVLESLRAFAQSGGGL